MESLGLGTSGWALQVGHFRLGTPGSFLGFLGLGTSGSLGSALSLRLGTPESLEGWPLQGVSRSRPGEEKSSGRGAELNLKSINPHTEGVEKTLNLTPCSGTTLRY